MSEQELLNELEHVILMGHINEEDEGLDGTMQGTPGTEELVKKALEEGIDPEKLLKTFGGAMEKVGEKFESGEFFLPDMMASGECVGSAMEIVEPKLAAGTSYEKGKFLIATVQGDLHDIGKNIVATMIKGAGYHVKDLGIDVPAENILEAIKEYEPNFVGLSALLTTTMVEMEQVVKRIREEGYSDIKIFIGGVPTSQEFADKIGADHHCKDAMEALNKLEKVRDAS